MNEYRFFWKRDWLREAELGWEFIPLFAVTQMRVLFDFTEEREDGRPVPEQETPDHAGVQALQVHDHQELSDRDPARDEGLPMVR